MIRLISYTVHNINNQQEKYELQSLTPLCPDEECLVRRTPRFTAQQFFWLKSGDKYETGLCND